MEKPIGKGRVQGRGREDVGTDLYVSEPIFLVHLPELKPVVRWG
jgi:hypothetical protein